LALMFGPSKDSISYIPEKSQRKNARSCIFIAGLSNQSDSEVKRRKPAERPHGEAAGAAVVGGSCLAKSASRQQRWEVFACAVLEKTAAHKTGVLQNGFFKQQNYAVLSKKTAFGFAAEKRFFEQFFRCAAFCNTPARFRRRAILPRFRRRGRSETRSAPRPSDWGRRSKTCRNRRRARCRLQRPSGRTSLRGP